MAKKYILTMNTLSTILTGNDEDFCKSSLSVFLLDEALMTDSTPDLLGHHLKYMKMNLLHKSY